MLVRLRPRQRHPLYADLHITISQTHLIETTTTRTPAPSEGAALEIGVANVLEAGRAPREYDSPELIHWNFPDQASSALGSAP